jgi:CRP/FNR family transcriptional regulator
MDSQTTASNLPCSNPGSAALPPESVPPSLERHARGSEIYRAGDDGVAWRVCLGAVRLDQHLDGETRFAGVAVAGDIIGAEVLMFGRYTYTARALSELTLEPWSSSLDEVAPGKLMQMLSGIERRSVDSIALRSGSAERRIGQLLGLIGRGLALGRSKVRVALPTLRDIAEITGLTIETVSRTIKSLRGNGELEMVGERQAREVWVESGEPPAVSFTFRDGLGTGG